MHTNMDIVHKYERNIWFKSANEIHVLVKRRFKNINEDIHVHVTKVVASKLLW